MQDNLAYKPYDKRREERISGKAVMMVGASVPHNLITGNIYAVFYNYLKGKNCTPFADGTKVFLSDENHFIPDMMVVCNKEKIQLDGIHGAPDMVAEVLSPSTMNFDRWEKKTAYERAGVQEYWIVSPGDLSIEVYQMKNGCLSLTRHTLSIQISCLLK